MELLCIGIRDTFSNASKLIDNQLDFFKKENLYIDKYENKIGDTVFLKYETKESTNTKYINIKEIFKHYIADAISDIIIDYYQYEFVSKLINDRCYYFSKKEKDIIKEKAIDFLKKNEYITAEGIKYTISKKTRILREIIEYLDFNNEIIIDGFVKFRLKFFIDTIEEAIEKGIEDFLMEREYNEFINILQYFVDIQEPKIDLVNVVIKDDKYLLHDELGRIINNDFLEEIADELSESDINYDDLLISSLITIAPKKIVVHIEESADKGELLKLIDSVFFEKVIICNGCSLCGHEVKLKNKVKKE